MKNILGETYQLIKTPFLKMKLLLLLLAAGARAACPSSCSVITGSPVFLPNGTSDTYVDGTEDCTSSTIDLAATATFSFPVAFAANTIFSDTVMQFTAAVNGTTNSTISIKVENEGLVHECGLNATRTFTNDTVVEWVVPPFVAGQTYSTPDLSSLINSLSGCSEAFVFVLEGPSSGRIVNAYETLANSTSLIVNGACPPSAPSTPSVEESESSEGLNTTEIALLIIGGGGVVASVLLAIFIRK